MDKTQHFLKVLQMTINKGSFWEQFLVSSYKRQKISFAFNVHIKRNAKIEQYCFTQVIYVQVLPVVDIYGVKMLKANDKKQFDVTLLEIRPF